MKDKHRKTIVWYAIFLLGTASTESFAYQVQPHTKSSSVELTLATGSYQRIILHKSKLPSREIEWRVDGVPGGNYKVGTISSDGVYVAPKMLIDSPVQVEAIDLTGNRLIASTNITVVEDPAVTEAHKRWLAGVALVAAQHGCNPNLIQQLRSESVTEAVNLFAQVAQVDSCLILLPVSPDPQAIRYSFASGGEINGINILYICDVNQMRIWNGAEVEVK